MIRVLVNPVCTRAVSFSWNPSDPQIVECTYCHSYDSDSLQVLIKGNPHDSRAWLSEPDLHGNPQQVASIGTVEATPFGREDARRIWEVLVGLGWVVADESLMRYIWKEQNPSSPDEMRFREFLSQMDQT